MLEAQNTNSLSESATFSVLAAATAPLAIAEEFARGLLNTPDDLHEGNKEARRCAAIERAAGDDLRSYVQVLEEAGCPVLSGPGIASAPLPGKPRIARSAPQRKKVRPRSPSGSKHPTSAGKIADKARWRSPVPGTKGPGLRDHAQKHADDLGLDSVGAYDTSARATIRHGRRFVYRYKVTLPSGKTGWKKRVGYYRPTADGGGLLTVTSQTGKKPTILSHYRTTKEKLKGAEGVYMGLDTVLTPDFAERIRAIKDRPGRVRGGSIRFLVVDLLRYAHPVKPDDAITQYLTTNFGFEELCDAFASGEAYVLRLLEIGIEFEEWPKLFSLMDELGALAWLFDDLGPIDDSIRQQLLALVHRHRKFYEDNILPSTLEPWMSGFWWYSL